ncbi:MAG: ABC transporter permease subunit [Planctomycetes bacterium]|nr:ABC transporter permease subunit [Planctomycetota bacterium]
MSEPEKRSDLLKSSFSASAPAQASKKEEPQTAVPAVKSPSEVEYGGEHAEGMVQRARSQTPPFSFANVYAILSKELKQMFFSPIAYIFIGVFLFTTAAMYLWVVEGGYTDLEIGEVQLRTYFSFWALYYVIFIPSLTMRTWAEEKKQRTLELLFCYPLRDSEVVFGKYLASLTILLLAIAMTFPVPLYVSQLGAIDTGPVFGAYLGVALMGIAFLAAGTFFSSLFSSQIVSFIVSVAFLAIFWILGAFSAVERTLSNVGLYFLTELSPETHFSAFAKGIVDTNDVVFFVSFTIFFLFLNVVAVGSRKW